MTDVVAPAQQLLRFAGVGIAATMVHVAIAAVAGLAFGFEPFVANFIGFAVAFGLSYLGHFHLTFALRAGHRQHLVRFLVLSLAGLAASSGTIWLMTVRLDLPPLLAFAAVGVVVPLVSFLLARSWAFNASRSNGGVFYQMVAAAGVVGLAAAIYCQLQLNHDSSWYLVATRSWLAGAQLYSDIMEINPPMAFFLTLPAIGLADLLGIDDTRAFILYVVLLAGLSLGVSVDLLRRAEGLSDAQRWVLLAGAVVALLVVPFSDFGQREQLMVILILPYVLAAALAPRKLRLPGALAIAIALAAGVGLALKPHFLAAPILLTLAIAWQERSWRPLIAPANLIIGAVCAAYALVVWLGFPDYFAVIIPLGQATYGAYGAGLLPSLLSPILLVAPIALLLAISSSPTGADRLVTIRFAAVAAAFALAYAVQAKGWPYQLIPLAAFLVMTLAWSVATSSKGRAVALSPVSLALASIVALTVVGGPYQNLAAAAFRPVVERHGEGVPVLVLSSNVSAAFPMVNETRAVWTSRYPAQWIVPGAVQRLREEKCAEPEACSDIREALAFARSTAVEDFLQGEPTIVFVDQRQDKSYFGGVPFDYLDWLGHDPRFAAAFAGYRRMGDAGGYSVWERS
jgi:putative flippase GtrA